LFVAVLSAQMKRIEGDRPTFTYLQLAAGATSLAPIIVAPLAWCAAAFRPEHSPDTLQALSDLGFLTMVMTTPAAMAQVFAVGMVVLSDKSVRPVFPRWVAPSEFCGRNRAPVWNVVCSGSNRSLCLGWHTRVGA
jgi:hypothetical protein